MLQNVNRLKNWHILIILFVVSVVVFGHTLSNPFQGDDFTQIVNNVPVHSIRNIKLFFEGGTFYNGHGLAPLTGVYYRPLMVTSFSFIYSLFGSSPIYFHIFQLLLVLAISFVLYLFLRYTFSTATSLFMALLFLIIPINSENVLSLANIQDNLFMLFGLLALWLLLRYKSIKVIFLVALLLVLSVFSKETGGLFIVMALIYLYIFDKKKRFSILAISLVPPLVIYAVLRIHAIGISPVPKNAPIDNLNLVHRLISAPAILAFYVYKLVDPIHLSQQYYWLKNSLSLKDFYLPLVIVLIIMLTYIYGGFRVYKYLTKSMFATYLFFAVWTIIGFGLVIQIYPLDMTVSESWIYFPLIGLIALTAIFIKSLELKLDYRIIYIVAILLLSLMGLRTYERGSNYSSQIVLAKSNLVGSKENYIAYNTLANQAITIKAYKQAIVYSNKSISIYPAFVNYLNLGQAYAGLGEYNRAAQAYYGGLKYANYYSIYEQIAELTLVYGNKSVDKQFLLEAVDRFPGDANIWTYLALLDQRVGDNKDARAAILKANSLQPVNPTMLNGILNNYTFNVVPSFSTQAITIKAVN